MLYMLIIHEKYRVGRDIFWLLYVTVCLNLSGVGHGRAYWGIRILERERPDRPFANFRVSISGDRFILCNPGTSCDGF